MFDLLNGVSPEGKKFVAEGIIDGQFVEYLATRTKEFLNIYENETMDRVVGAIYVSKPILDAETGKNIGDIQVAGKWEKFGYLLGINLKPNETSPLLMESGLIESQRNVKLVKRKEKYLTYTKLTEKVEPYDERKHGSSVENYLYISRKLEDIIKEKNVDLSWTENKNYRVLTNTAEIMEWIDGLEKTNEIVGFDTETSGLLVNNSKKDTLVGICMSYEDNAGVYFPLEHIRMENVEMGKEAFLELLKPYIDYYSPKKKKLVGHNLNFDWKAMRMHDIYLNVVYDTFHRFSIMNISNAKGMAGLKAIAKRRLNIDVIELSDMYEPRSKSDIATVKDAVFNQGLIVNPITEYKLARSEKFDDLKYDFRFASEEFVRIYGSADADFPRLIHKQMDKEWDKSLDFVYQIEIGVIPALGEQEYFGVKAKEEDFQKLRTTTEAELAQLEIEIFKEAGEEFKISSSQQKADILFEKLNCPKLPRFKTKSGGMSTDKGTMEALEKYTNPDGSPTYPIVPLLQKYSKKQTLVSNFYSKLPSLIHSDHLFASYKQMGAETGRISCSNPNLQQTEPTSRTYMTVDSDEYYFLVCDYSQVEYRIMAGMSHEKKVVDFFSLNPEADYHIMGATRSSIKLVA